MPEPPGLVTRPRGAAGLNPAPVGRVSESALFDDSWHAWTNLGRPNPSQSVNIHHTSAITYLDTRGGDRHIWVFVYPGVYQGSMHANMAGICVFHAMPGQCFT
jgi:hypothetical protein